ncbi:MAG TPA: preprotein translocase subunit SecE [Terriglobales bacterium]|nr:preprotein translocase subunit SecE [Terriglobales bacterium]
MALAVQSNPTADKVKLGLAALIVLAAMAGFYYFSASPLVVRIGVLLAGAAAAAGVAWTSEPGKRFFAYCGDAMEETKKVVWPSRKETIQTTGVVVAFVIVMALFLWIVDASLVWLVRVLVGREA